MSTASAPTAFQRRRVGVFCLVAFGLSWTVGAVIYVTGGLRDSPVLIETPRITLAVAPLSTGYMWAPAVANVVTRVVTDEGWTDRRLCPRRREWPVWIVAWLGPVLWILVGIGADALLVAQAVVDGGGGLAFVSGTPTPLLGPAAVGVVASLGWVVVL